MSKYEFSEESLQRLRSAHTDLQNIAHGALQSGIIDFSVTCGHRGKEDQNKALLEGKSRAAWPNGPHNNFPSNAIDLVPYVNGKLSWNRLHCCVLAGIIIKEADARCLNIRWGGNWDMDGEPITDQDFQDLVHFERVLPRAEISK